jgi:hypothetical protein
MDKLRVKQAQTLFKEATKSKKTQEKLKPPEEGFINVKLFEKILNDLFEAEDYIYSSRPSHKLDQDDAESFTNKIIAAREGIELILSDFGVIEKKNPENDIKEYSKDLLIITTKNSFKKSITKFGVDPQRIVVAGVPLDSEDMKILNPKIPESALNSIQKKIKHVKNDIERKMEQFNLKEVIVLVEKDKPGEILGNRAEKLYNARTISTENLKDITPGEFIIMVS